MGYGDVWVSVIVTAYNIEGYLPKCIESLLKQDYSKIEIILVDDGSVDGTGSLCDSYAQEHENIRVLHRPNGGPAAARNSGLKLAKGDYIGYVDGDDWVEPDMYGKMLKACLDHQAPIAVCAYRQIGEGAVKIVPTGKVLRLSREEALDWYINGHPQYHIYHSVWSKLFDRRLLEGIRFPEGRKSEDIMYTTQAMVKAVKCVFLDIPLYNYRVDRANSIMNSQLAERRFGDEIPFWREQADYLRRQGMEALADQAEYRFYRKMLDYYMDFRQRNMKDAAEKLISMLRSEKAEIKRIYRSSFTAMGDRVRMKLALCSPGGYYRITRFYDRVIIPLRQHSLLV